MAFGSPGKKFWAFEQRCVEVCGAREKQRPTHHCHRCLMQCSYRPCTCRVATVRSPDQFITAMTAWSSPAPPHRPQIAWWKRPRTPQGTAAWPRPSRQAPCRAPFPAMLWFSWAPSGRDDSERLAIRAEWSQAPRQLFRNHVQGDPRYGLRCCDPAEQAQHSRIPVELTRVPAERRRV